MKKYMMILLCVAALAFSVTQVFAGYDLDNDENAMKWPFVAFRINGVIRFKRECPISNTYSVTTTN